MEALAAEEAIVVDCVGLDAPFFLDSLLAHDNIDGAIKTITNINASNLPTFFIL